MNTDPINLLIAGVGGQGVILASYVLSEVALADGFDVKQSEVHGMSQRGGSVTSHLRVGKKVWSPLIAPGCAHVLLSFEMLETLRYLHWLKPDGIAVYNTLRVNPSSVAAGTAEYPADVAARIAARTPGARAVDATGLAIRAGNPRAANMVMLGAASCALPFRPESWKAVISDTVPPKTVEANLRAFELGLQAAACPIKE